MLHSFSTGRACGGRQLSGFPSLLQAFPMLWRQVQKYWDTSGCTKLQTHDEINGGCGGGMSLIISLAVNGFSKKPDCRIEAFALTECDYVFDLHLFSQPVF